MTLTRIGRWVGRIAAGLVVLLIVCLGALYLWLRTSLSRIDGVMTMPGLSAAVTVQHDRFGIPHISAQSIDDAIFALGYVQAQDRIFQMDLMRHFGEGRISELAGKGTIDRDRLMRTLGLERAARRQLNALKTEVRKILADFAAGVNAYIEHHPGAKQPCYYMLPGPEPWRPLDTAGRRKADDFLPYAKHGARNPACTACQGSRARRAASAVPVLSA